MKRSLAFTIVFCLVGCAAKPPTRAAEVDVTAGKTRIFLPAFLTLERSDLDALSAVKRAKGLKLSGSRTAECTPKLCTIADGKGSRIPVSSRDVAAFVALQKMAVKTGKEATKTEGPVTLHCGADRCTADLLIETTGPVKIQGTAKVEAEPELDVAGSLLQGFVRGLVGGQR